MMPDSPQHHQTATNFNCHICSQDFSRMEHLTRHFRTHMNEKPHVCSACNKSFSRSDILKRHQSSHRLDCAIKVRPGAGSGFRACIQCAAARIKCTGEIPCQRCSSKMLECRYPAQSEKQSRTRRQPKRSATQQNNKLAQSAISTAQHDENMTLEDSQAQFWSDSNTIVVNGQYDTSSSDHHRPQFLTQPSHSLPEISMAETAEEPEYYETQIISNTQPQSAQPEPRAPSVPGLDHHLTGQNFDLGSDRNLSIIPYEFASDQPFDKPQRVEFGYSAINWLSPRDLSYSQVMWDNQYFDVNDFNSITNPVTQTIAQNTNLPEVHNAHQDLYEYSRLSQSDTSQRIRLNFYGPQGGDASIITKPNSPRSSSIPSRSSNYYVDGAGARQPRYGKLVDEFKKHFLGNNNPFKTPYFPPVAIFDLSKHLYYDLSKMV